MANFYDPRGGGNVHFDQVLTNISVDWMNEMDLAADALFPPISVNHQTDKYYIYDRSSWKQEPGDDYRAPGSVANEIPGRKLSMDTYYTQEHALTAVVTPEERQNATAPIDPEADAVTDVTSKIARGRELMAQQIAANPDNYLSDHVVTLSGDDQWDQSDGKPVDVMRDITRTFHLNMGVLPNVAVIPWRIMSYLEDNAQFLDRVKYVQAQVPNRELVRQFFEIDQIVVPGARFDKSRHGQPSDISYLWGNNIILAYVPPSPSLRTPSYGYEFVWPLYGATQYTDRWWSDERKADMIRTGRSYDLKLVAKEPETDETGRFQTGEKSVAGVLIKDVIADDTGLNT